MNRARKPSQPALRLLAAFMERPRAWRYGYDLARELELKSGTLYPLLIRLSDQGFLESDWKPSDSRGNPPRHMYRLSPKGIAFARAQPVEIEIPDLLGRRVGAHR